MFKLWKRFNNNGTLGAWFPIWTSEDGADTAEYLRQCVEIELPRAKANKTVAGEFKMTWEPKEGE